MDEVHFTTRHYSSDSLTIVINQSVRYIRAPAGVVSIKLKIME